MITRHYWVLFGSVFFLVLRTAAGAQETPSLDNIPQGMRDRAIVMEIATRVVEQNEQVVWDSENTRVTIPGKAVGLKLVGTNIVIVVQFTPYIRPRGENFLVAQGQIWIHIPDSGMSFHTSIETIPMDFNEKIFFFPLGTDGSGQDGSQGKADSDDSVNQAQIEMQIVVYPYSQDSFSRDSPDRDSSDRNSSDRDSTDNSGARRSRQ
ncbi:MAG: hypothetical protein FWD78_10220 [Treponema sp.]|nr:hypothetical protein [Treponema sp.]